MHDSSYKYVHLNISCQENVPGVLASECIGWEVILVSVFETALPGIAVPPGATITSRSAVRYRINGWALYLLREIEPIHLSVEGLRPWDWSYPLLQYLRECPHSDNYHRWYGPLSLNHNIHPRSFASFILAEYHELSRYMSRYMST